MTRSLAVLLMFAGVQALGAQTLPIVKPAWTSTSTWLPKPAKRVSTTTAW